MSAEMKWRKAWRLNRYGAMIPEEVEIMDVEGEYVLVKGERHTTYGGYYFATKEAAFDSAIAEEEQSLQSGQRRLDNLHKAKARHCSA